MSKTFKAAARFFKNAAAVCKKYISQHAWAAKRAAAAGAMLCAAGAIAFVITDFVSNVTIVTAGREFTVRTARAAPDVILARSSVEFTKDDEVLCDYDKGGNLSVIKINPAFEVTVKADGAVKKVGMLRGTVGDALKKAGVRLGEHDTLNYEPDAEVFAGMVIDVDRIVTSVEVVEEPISCSTRYRASIMFRDGVEKIERKGRDGIRRITTTTVYKDGVEVSSKRTSKVVKRALDRIVIVGSKDAGAFSPLEFPDVRLGEDGLPTEYTKVLTGIATAYGKNDGSITSTGTKPGLGYIAVNPKVIPYGTRMYIVSSDGNYVYGCAVAADTGPSVLKNKTIADLFLGSDIEIYWWGRRSVDIYILD